MVATVTPVIESYSCFRLRKLRMPDWPKINERQRDFIHSLFMEYYTIMHFLSELRVNRYTVVREWEYRKCEY